MTQSLELKEYELAELENALAVPTISPRSNGRLVIASEPKPFVAPRLRVTDPRNSAAFAVEVVFVQASAAVGKSRMASYLSARKNVPLLDLSVTRVSTHSLMGLLQAEIDGPVDPVDAFQTGHLPLIVDALDEGRLLSEERNFEEFIASTGELLQRNRTVIDRPKLIFFGRPDSVELARLALTLISNEISTSVVDVSYFGKDAALQLIDVYARTQTSDDSSYLIHPGPVRDLVQAYFSAIESALALQQGELWADERGRAFAGYAPVLAALGSLLAEVDNFLDVINRLKNSGNKQAWGVIETVLHAILDREQGKLRDKLVQQVRGPVPEEAYDADEQLTFLTRLITGKIPEGTGRVKLSGGDQEKYYLMARQYLPEHPFIKQGKFGNAVLESVVLAHAINNDLLDNGSLSLAESASRQPFLWRSMQRQLAKADSLVDGRYIGCLLNSFWNDPIASDRKVYVRTGDEEGSVMVNTEGETDATLFRGTSPIVMFGQAKNVWIDIQDRVTLHGNALSGSASSFYVVGDTALIADAIAIEADSIVLDGRIWMEADNVVAPARVNVRKKSGEVGWGNGFTVFPWNRIEATLRAPYRVPAADRLGELLEECELRLPSTGALTLTDDLLPPDDDRRMRWVSRTFSDDFPRMLELMINSGWASKERMSASGSPKTRVRLATSWSDVRGAYLRREEHPELDQLIATLKARF